MRLRNFRKNTRAITMMYDAVLFVVMVSLSGAALLPALQSELAVEGSIEKHREEVVDEALLMILTSRADDFGYTLAGSQIESITGIDVDYSGPDPDIIETLVKTFLGREQKHKTYADLCVEGVICQVKILGTRINIFTEDFDESLREEITKVLNNFLGEKYLFRFVTRWKPIMGLDFGGDLEIGPIPPDTTHVAKTYVTLPNTFFSDWLKYVEEFIIEQVNNITSWASNDNRLKLQIKNLTYNILENITVKGFNGHSSVIEKTIDYVFKPVEKGIDKIFGSSAEMVMDPIKQFCSSVIRDLETEFYNILNGCLPGFTINDIDGDGNINTTEALDSLKSGIANEVGGMLTGLFDSYLDSFADFIVETINVVLQPEKLKDGIIDFFKENINVLRAEMVLTIWEARG